MKTQVAVVRFSGDPTPAYITALDLIGGIDLLIKPDRPVTIKVGIFDPRSVHHTSVDVLRSITTAFTQAPEIAIVESDNYCGKALDRLKCYQEIFSDRIIPGSLSEDPHGKMITAAGDEMQLGNLLFKPRVFVSTHTLRTFKMGSILKNLFGCTPMVKKAKYHKNELYPALLADIFEAVGGIDLAVLDGSFLYFNGTNKRVPADVLVVGRDAVAVETVGAVIAGLKPEKMPVIQEFVRRGLGAGSLDEIEIVGLHRTELSTFVAVQRSLKKLIKEAPKMPGISDTIDQLIQEGWMDVARCAPEVVDELQERGVKNAKKEVVETTLKRRTSKTLERAKEGDRWVYWRKDR